MTSGIIWQHLKAPGSIWRHLAEPGGIWAGGIWQHLAVSGIIWQHLAASGLPPQNDPSPGARSQEKASFFCEVVDTSTCLIKLIIFLVFKQNAKNDDDQWEALTFAKLSGQFTKCIGDQFHQVLYLSTGEAGGTWETFLGVDQVLLPYWKL